MSEKIADPVFGLSFCNWSLSESLFEDEVWKTACDNLYILLEGTPKENDYNFCPGCGRHIKEV